MKMVTGAVVGGSAMASASQSIGACIERLDREPLPVTGVKVILIDRTTPFAPTAVAEMVKKMAGWPRPTDRIVVLAFGGIEPELLRMEFDTYFEPIALPERIVSETPTRRHADYVTCAKSTDTASRAKLKEILTNILSVPNTSLEGHSPILDALRAVSSIYADQTITSKSLILISDGIEHTRQTARGMRYSFYLPGGDEVVKELDAAAIVDGIRKENRIPDLAGVRIWHAGLAQPANSRLGLNRSRSSAEISTLREFWTGYWVATKGKLIEFGQPVPLQPLSR